MRKALKRYWFKKSKRGKELAEVWARGRAVAYQRLTFLAKNYIQDEDGYVPKVRGTNV